MWTWDKLAPLQRCSVASLAVLAIVLLAGMCGGLGGVGGLAVFALLLLCAVGTCVFVLSSRRRTAADTGPAISESEETSGCEHPAAEDAGADGGDGGDAYVDDGLYDGDLPSAYPGDMECPEAMPGGNPRPKVVRDMPAARTVVEAEVQRQRKQLLRRTPDIATLERARLQASRHISARGKRRLLARQGTRGQDSRAAGPSGPSGPPRPPRPSGPCPAPRLAPGPERHARFRDWTAHPSRTLSENAAIKLMGRGARLPEPAGARRALVTSMFSSFPLRAATGMVQVPATGAAAAGVAWDRAAKPMRARTLAPGF